MRLLPLLVFAALLPAPPVPAQSIQLEHAFPALRFERPVDFQHADNRLFVVEQRGMIWVFENHPSASQATAFLDIRSRVSRAGNEEGLLGLAFAPDYPSSGTFYVYYSVRSPRRSIVARFQRSASDDLLADVTSESVVMTIAQPYSNHNGGQLAFGPDGYLYIGLGDGGSAGDPQGHGQNRSTLLGSLLRIDVSTTPYAIPIDNPFAGNTSGHREEIWAWGLRNPWRFSFDKATGRLYLADVGQNAWEEIDEITKGGNYGWPVMEGPACFRPPSGCSQSGLALPIHSYASGGMPRSVTGGYVYRSTSVPALQGRYIYGDYVSGAIWALDTDSTAGNMLLAETPHSISSFGQGPHGEVYTLAFDGRLYRFSPAALNMVPAVEDQHFTAGTAITPLTLPSATGGVVPYTYQLIPDPPEGITLDEHTWTLSGTPTAGASTATYSWQVSDAVDTAVSLTFTITIAAATNSEHAAPKAGLIVHGNYPNPFSETTAIVLDLGRSAQVQISVLDLLGRTVLDLGPQRMAAGAGQHVAIGPAAFPAGTYLYRVTAGTGGTKRTETGTMLRIH